MKNKVLILSVIFAVFTNISFAQSDSKKTIGTPSEDQVIVVGRIHFSTDIDRNYLYDAFEIPEERRDFKDIVVLPFYTPGMIQKPSKSGSISYTTILKPTLSLFNSKAWVANNNYFYIKYTVGPDRILYLTSATAFIGGSHLLPVMLPMYFKIKIPEDEKYIYIGDFYYHAEGVDFKLSANVKDDFDSAKEALDTVTKDEVSLCRVVKQPFDADDRLGFAHSPIQTLINQWYSRVEEVSEEAELQ